MAQSLLQCSCWCIHVRRAHSVNGHSLVELEAEAAVAAARPGLAVVRAALHSPGVVGEQWHVRAYCTFCCCRHAGMIRTDADPSRIARGGTAVVLLP